MEMIIPIISSLSVASPLIITWAVGIVIAVMRWQRHPRVSQLVVIALGVLIVAAVLNLTLNVLLPQILMRSGGDATTLGVVFTITGAIFSLIQTVCWAMILVALFGWRNTQEVKQA